MSYALQSSEDPGRGLRRVLREQADKLVAEAEHALDDADAFIHGARVRTKKIRAALRLGRPLMSDSTYRRANRWWRDQARLLGAARDRCARIEAVDSLASRLADALGEAAVHRLRARFLREQADLFRSHELADCIVRFANSLTDEAAAPPEMDDGSLDDLAGSFTQGYRDARSGLKASLETPSDEAVHDWRKAVKRHGLQACLLRNAFGESLAAHMKTASELAALLGDVQDAQVLGDALDGDEDAEARAALGAQRDWMLREAWDIGASLFAEKPKRWAAVLSEGVMA